MAFDYLYLVCKIVELVAIKRELVHKNFLMFFLNAEMRLLHGAPVIC